MFVIGFVLSVQKWQVTCLYQLQYGYNPPKSDWLCAKKGFFNQC